MSKPANYYASIATIPDYVETAIAQLSRHDLYNFAGALIESMRDRCWTTDRQNFNINFDTDQWLSQASVDTFKSIHKWLSNELI